MRRILYYHQWNETDKSFSQIVYWFLLHDIIGPVVINMARAVLDIFIIGITYAVMLFAFTSGMTFLVIFRSEKKIFLNSFSPNHQFYRLPRGEPFFSAKTKQQITILPTMKQSIKKFSFHYSGVFSILESQIFLAKTMRMTTSTQE